MGWGADNAAQNAWYALPVIDAIMAFDCVDTCLYNIFPSGSGEIISAASATEYGNPLAGVLVVADCHAGGQYQAYSNRRGIYAFAGVPSSAAAFTIVPSKSGYVFGARTAQTGASQHYQNYSGNQAAWILPKVGPAERRRHIRSWAITRESGRAPWHCTALKQARGRWGWKAARVILISAWRIAAGPGGF